MSGPLRNSAQQLTSPTNSGLAAFAVAMGVALVAFAIWFFAHQCLPWKLWSDDACEYAEMGRRLVAGEGFTTGVIYPAELHFGAGADKPAVMRPPAWPVALAAAFAVAGPTERVAHALTGALFVGIAVLTTALGSALAGPLVGALAGITLACLRANTAALALGVVALGTTIAVALGLPQGRYFVPLLPAALALGTFGWQRYGAFLAIPGLALVLLAPWLPSFPAPRVDLALLTGYFDVERRAHREDPERAARERARYAALRKCLPDRPLVLAQGAARLVWETGGVAVYAPNHPSDFWKIADRHPIEFAQMERWRKIDRERFERAFDAADDCADDLYRRR